MPILAVGTNDLAIVYLFRSKLLTMQISVARDGRRGGRGEGGGVKLSSYEVITMCLCVRTPGGSDPADM